MSTPASPKVVVWRGEEPQKIRQNYCPASEVCIFNLSLLLPVRIYKLSVAILATGRADQAPPCDLPACLLVVRLPPLSVLRRLAQVPPLSVLRRLMEPLALKILSHRQRQTQKQSQRQSQRQSRGPKSRTGSSVPSRQSATASLPSQWEQHCQPTGHNACLPTRWAGAK